MQASKGSIAPALGQMQQMPFHSMAIPNVPSGAQHGTQGQPRMAYNTMMPPRPAVNMPAPGIPTAGDSHQALQQEPGTQAPPASPPLEPSARVAAELVVTLGAKMKEICEHQTVLVEQMQSMQQKIEEKDGIIMKLQKDERGDAGSHERERVEMASELTRLKQQVRSMQTLMEAAAEAAPDVTGGGVAARLSELALDSGDTEEDSTTTKDEDADEEQPSTASTSDGRPASAQSALTSGSGRCYFKPMTTASSKKKRRDLDDLFKPKDSQRSTH